MPDPAYRYAFVETNGARLHIVEQGEGPAVLFCHGFPDGWRGWRRQMRAVAEAGYRSIAFDVRGYGDSSIPEEPTDYTLFKVAGDLVGLCAALGIDRACLVGHDFGAALAWVAAMMRPDLFGAVFGISVPPMLVAGGDFLAEMRRQGLDDFYMFRQTAPGAEAEWADAATTIPGMLYWTSGLAPADRRWDPLDPRRGLTRPSPVGCPPFADAEDVTAAVASFTRNGFRGPLNFYRALQPYLDQAGAFVGNTIRQPSFLVVGGADGMVRLRRVTEADLRPMLVDLRGFLELEGIGHWPQLEATEALNELLLKFLASSWSGRSGTP